MMSNKINNYIAKIIILNKKIMKFSSINRIIFLTNINVTITYTKINCLVLNKRKTD